MSKLLLAIICLWIGTTLGVVFSALCFVAGEADEREGWKDDDQRNSR